LVGSGARSGWTANTLSYTSARTSAWRMSVSSSSLGHLRPGHCSRTSTGCRRDPAFVGGRSRASSGSRRAVPWRCGTVTVAVVQVLKGAADRSVPKTFGLPWSGDSVARFERHHQKVACPWECVAKPRGLCGSATADIDSEARHRPSAPRCGRQRGDLRSLRKPTWVRPPWKKSSLSRYTRSNGLASS